MLTPIHVTLKRIGMIAHRAFVRFDFVVKSAYVLEKRVYMNMHKHLSATE